MDGGKDYATVYWSPSLPRADDDTDTDVDVDISRESGSEFTIGVTIVTVTATDDAGNSNVCKFSVTVYGESHPSIYSKVTS